MGLLPSAKRKCSVDWLRTTITSGAVLDALSAALQAVCCQDGNHCCPSGHSCDPHRATCSKGPHVTPWFTKLKAVTEPGGVTDVKCDDKSSCASGTTCCKLQTGEWGCCPLVKVRHTHGVFMNCRSA